MLFTVDHHRGSEENQAGWEHHDAGLVDPRTGRMDTLPWFRRTMAEAGLEDVVIAVIGSSPTVAAHWGTPLGAALHRRRARRSTPALADYRGWSPLVVPGGDRSLFHDVFEDPAAGGGRPTRCGACRGRRLRAGQRDRLPARPAQAGLRRRGSGAPRARSASASGALGPGLRDLDAGGEQLVGAEALGQPLPAEQARRGAVARERVRGEHHGRGVPRGLLHGVELAVEVERVALEVGAGPVPAAVGARRNCTERSSMCACS